LVPRLVSSAQRFALSREGARVPEADAARRLPPLRLMRCGRRAAVTLGGLLSRLGRRASVSPPRRLLCGVRPPPYISQSYV